MAYFTDTSWFTAFNLPGIWKSSKLMYLLGLWHSVSESKHTFFSLQLPSFVKDCINKLWTTTVMLEDVAGMFILQDHDVFFHVMIFKRQSSLYLLSFVLLKDKVSSQAVFPDVLLFLCSTTFLKRKKHNVF